MTFQSSITHAHTLRLQNAAANFLSIEGWSAPVAVTLTMKQGAFKDGGFVGLDRYTAQQNFRHFMNLLNHQTFGNSFQRHGKRMAVAAVLETDAGGRLHYHAALDRPAHIEPDHFRRLIRDSWAKTTWGHREIDIQFDADDGWITYLTKLRSKPDFADSIDWTNSSIH